VIDSPYELPRGSDSPADQKALASGSNIAQLKASLPTFVSVKGTPVVLSVTSAVHSITKSYGRKAM